jgi:hypothetical protein
MPLSNAERQKRWRDKRNALAKIAEPDTDEEIFLAMHRAMEHFIDAAALVASINEGDDDHVPESKEYMAELDIDYFTDADWKALTRLGNEDRVKPLLRQMLEHWPSTLSDRYVTNSKRNKRKHTPAE